MWGQQFIPAPFHSSQEYYQAASNFLHANIQLVQSHIVDFHTRHHISLVPQDWVQALINLEDEVLFRLPSMDPTSLPIPGSLQRFITTAQSFTLVRGSLSDSTARTEGSLGTLDQQLVFGMTPKKLYEIEQISDLIRSIAVERSTNNIIDIGGGKGHLSRVLALHFGMNVTSMDCNASNIKKANERMKGLSDLYIRRKRNQKPNASLSFVDPQSVKYEAVVKFVDTSVPLQSTMSRHSEGEEPPLENVKHILVGLHTCGNLSCSLLELFCTNECISGLVFVGCCYNMLTLPSPMTQEEKITNYSFPMSQFAKANSNFQMDKVLAMLGCQAVSRWADSPEHLHESVTSLSKNHYRAMLQVFLRDTYGINKTLSIGHMADGTTADFTTYTKSALRVLEKKILQIVDPSRLPNEEALNKAIEETFSKYNPDEKLLKVWWCVRGVLANVIESMILVDRLMYLREQGYPTSTLIPLFDPVRSPRSHCIVAIK